MAAWIKMLIGVNDAAFAKSLWPLVIFFSESLAFAADSIVEED